MRKTRINYTQTNKSVILTDWIKARGMNQKQFQDFLAQRDVLISPRLCAVFFSGQRTPGPKFRELFKEASGIVLK